VAAPHADAEHQQDDADPGELFGQRLVGHDTRGEGTDSDAGEQIADDGQRAQPARDRAEQEGETQALGDRRDGRRGVVHQRVGHPPARTCNVAREGIKSGPARV
jgi:hypothetical protein